MILKVDILICADTVVIVSIDGKWKILEKPANKEEAMEMMRLMSGKEHFVVTAVTIILPKTNITQCFYEETKVKFGCLSEEDIDIYCDTDEP